MNKGKTIFIIIIFIIIVIIGAGLFYVFAPVEYADPNTLDETDTIPRYRAMQIERFGPPQAVEPEDYEFFKDEIDQIIDGGFDDDVIVINATTSNIVILRESVLSEGGLLETTPLDDLVAQLQALKGADEELNNELDILIKEISQ